jgi:hypothetical protein
MANAMTAPSKNLPHFGTCYRCAGLGRLTAHAHIEGGWCFYCKGDCVVVYKPGAFAWDRAERADFIAFVADGLKAFGVLGEEGDDFVKRSARRVRKVISSEVSRVSVLAARAGHLDVFDRAQKALDAHSKRDWIKVAALRAKIEGELAAAKAQEGAAA